MLGCKEIIHALVCTFLIKGLRAAEKKFYPNRRVPGLVFRVAESSEYLDMHRFPRLEYKAASCAIPAKHFYRVPKVHGVAESFHEPKALYELNELAVTDVPARPSTAASIASMAVMTARRPVADEKRDAASTLGPMEPAGN